VPRYLPPPPPLPFPLPLALLYGGDNTGRCTNTLSLYLLVEVPLARAAVALPAVRRHAAHPAQQRRRALLQRRFDRRLRHRAAARVLAAGQHLRAPPRRHRLSTHRARVKRVAWRAPPTTRPARLPSGARGRSRKEGQGEGRGRGGALRAAAKSAGTPAWSLCAPSASAAPSCPAPRRASAPRTLSFPHPRAPRVRVQGAWAQRAAPQPRRRRRRRRRPGPCRPRAPRRRAAPPRPHPGRAARRVRS